MEILQQTNSNCTAIYHLPKSFSRNLDKKDDPVLRKWIAYRLKEQGHGARARLAQHLGITRNAVTRMLKSPMQQNYRMIKASELIGIAEFFNQIPPGFYPDLANQEANQANQANQANHKLIDLFERASHEDKEKILSYVKFIISNKKNN